jgi:hypothetical protein
MKQKCYPHVSDVWYFSDLFGCLYVLHYGGEVAADSPLLLVLSYVENLHAACFHQSVVRVFRIWHGLFTMCNTFLAYKSPLL